MVRRAFIALLAAALLGAGPATAAQYVAPAGSGALFLFNGHGWGHGVGMSQYGAFGMAQNGYTLQQILQHYYPGTTIGPAPQTTIRVLLADGKKTLTVWSSVPFTAQDGAGVTHQLPAGPVKLDATLLGWPAPLTFSPGAGATLTLGRAYRGQILVDLVGTKLRAVNVLPLEQYLYGVVPSEMPSSWLPSALQAQAIAARSYALATRKLAAPFDVYSDTRSQMYLGVAAERPAATAAVDATAGQVVLYQGTVADTVFSSTSGGETESAVDAWGTNVPYLISVPDPFDVISPFHDWGPVPLPAATLATQLKVSGPLVSASTTPNLAGRVASLSLLTQTGLTATVTGAAAQARLGLRSTWFDVGVLSLSAPLTIVPYGTAVTLTGLVQNVDGAYVEARSAPGAWAQVGPVEQGTLTLTETPTVTTDYRLATPDAAAAYVRVRVTPAITLTEQDANGVAGTVQPLLPGAQVAVQQAAPAGTLPAWTTLANGTIDSTGAFAIPVALQPGAYRVLVTPSAGYSPGSAAVTVGG
ncbi:MAG: SpoIID/LytB domain-containing protein [Actinobacteria bacterium]|nr:SpoIID/LytB domain-containing protein [Actinomycetota bacterium]